MTRTNSTIIAKGLKNNIYLTAKGLAEAKAELDRLKKLKRAEIADRINQAREYGDLTENSEYDTAMEDQALNENRIAELEEILKGAKVIKEEHDNEFVVIGSTIKIEMDDGIDEFTIVGRVEADPTKKRISNESPLGSALLGARKDEVVEVATPIVRYKCKVLEIK
ncbi:transcription elongation factor GreA [Candidatus Daviesbacteria bacterium]|nr:transcription elongation factor GreA [Candidatus Daviesbacteria bacterium]